MVRSTSDVHKLSVWNKWYNEYYTPTASGKVLLEIFSAESKFGEGLGIVLAFGSGPLQKEL